MNENANITQTALQIAKERRLCSFNKSNFSFTTVYPFPACFCSYSMQHWAEYKNRYKDVTICNCFVTFPDRKVTIEKQVALRYNKIIKILLPAGTAGMSKSFRPERIL